MWDPKLHLNQQAKIIKFISSQFHINCLWRLHRNQVLQIESQTCSLSPPALAFPLPLPVSVSLFFPWVTLVFFRSHPQNWLHPCSYPCSLFSTKGTVDHCTGYWARHWTIPVKTSLPGSSMWMGLLRGFAVLNPYNLRWQLCSPLLLRALHQFPYCSTTSSKVL